MKKIQIVGFAIVAVFALSGLVASAAFAEVGMEWLVDAAAVTTAQNVELTGTLLLEDKGVPTGILCTGKGTGTVEANGKDIQLTAEATSCTTETGTCGEPLAIAVHLPWATEIVLVGTEVRDLIASGTGGTPGYEVTCFGIFHDSCAGVTSIGLENMATETPADVLGIFSETLSEAGNCSLGGTGKGVINGEVLITAAGGLALAVS